ncbi:MAG: 50S ribosomal protein L17 [Epsilonproteobacteria bacterium]|nr:MAG: 50S ribosomal protein L17 [Campylobacterota bacterium]
MRHKHGYRKLSRTTSHRKAMLENMTVSLITHEKIETTVPKAKELKRYVERLVTKARVGGPNAHRQIFMRLQCKQSTKKLINEIATNYKETPGGYTKIVRTRIRRGDATQMANISFVTKD